MSTSITFLVKLAAAFLSFHLTDIHLRQKHKLNNYVCSLKCMISLSNDASFVQSGKMAYVRKHYMVGGLCLSPLYYAYSSHMQCKYCQKSYRSALCIKIPSLSPLEHRHRQFGFHCTVQFQTVEFIIN